MIYTNFIHSTYHSSSRKAPHSTRLPVRRGGRRDLMKALAKSSVTSCTNPMARTAHPKPAVRSNWRAIAGKMRPPVADPEAAIPIARERFVEKYVDSVEMAGQKRQPLPMPRHRPCERIRCQYCVATDVVKMPRMVKTVPARSTGRKKPASVKRPVKVPMKKVRKIWIEPIQLMSEGGRSSRPT